MTLRVTIEIVPFGDENNKRVIETINISNLGTIQDDLCSYGVERNTYKTKDYDVYLNHHRGDGALALVQEAIGALIDEGSSSM